MAEVVSSTVPTETDSTPVGRVRIGDVALLAETSVSTVSNYLNGRPHRMAPETVARIEQVIDRLGYRPSWAARQLKTGFVPMLGLLVPSVANPFHGALARHVEEAVETRFGGNVGEQAVDVGDAGPRQHQRAVGIVQRQIAHHQAHETVFRNS